MLAFKMAEKALKKLDEQLKCPICLDTYTEPKQLQCSHSYCKKCLVKLVVQDQQGQLFLTCPTCRQVTSVPVNGLTGLQPAFHVNNLLEIKETLTANQKSAEINVTHFCSEHDKELELFCKTCGKLICLKCAITGEKHENHTYVELTEAFVKYKEELASLLEPMEGNLKNVNNALSGLNGRHGEISDLRISVEVNIHDTIRQLHEFLDIRKTELISHLYQITQDKHKSLLIQRERLDTIQAQLSSSLGFVKDILAAESQEEVLKMDTIILNQIKELATPLQPDKLKPVVEADITFSASEEIIAVCKNYGTVYVAKDHCPTENQVTGKSLEVAVVGKKSTTVLQTVNLEGEPFNEPVIPQCELVSEITGTTVKGSVKKKKHCKYEFSYQPTIKGRHKLHVKVKDQHVRGSPFTVVAKLPVERLGIPILTLGKVARPWGVAVNYRGKVVVTERDQHRVSVINLSGKKLVSFGTCGSGQGQFKYPHGIAVDGMGNIFVADRNNDRIQKFNTEGRFLSMVGTKGSGPLQFSFVTGIAYNTSNDKVYTVDENNRVQILNSDLTFYDIFGEKGSSKGQFDTPLYIACDCTGKVYVADTCNHRIQIFTAKGKFLKMFGGRELAYPVSIAVSTSNVYISESSKDQISVFNSDGHFIKSFGKEGEHPGEFKCPRSLAVDNEVLYVCDYHNNRIQLF